MALFLIYANTLEVDDEKQWQTTLQSLVKDYKHEVCVVSANAGAIRTRLLALNFPTVKCMEVKEEFCDPRHIEVAKKLADYQGKDVIVTAPVLARPEDLAEIIPADQRIIIDDGKNYFLRLQKLSENYKHSNSKEFEEIRERLEDIKKDLTVSWPTTPKENLVAQKNFLGYVLMLADNSPNCSMDECLIKARDVFESKSLLTEVITMPVNVGVLKWGLFRAVLNFNTLTGDLLKKVEERVAEKKEDERSKRAEAEARIIGVAFMQDVNEEAKISALEIQKEAIKRAEEEAVRRAELTSLSSGHKSVGYGSF